MSETHDSLEPARPATLLCCAPLLYERAWQLQRTYHAARAADRCRDMLLLVEHPPVYTVGRTTQDHHWPAGDQLMQQTGIPVVRTERGGSITYHGPGQAVGYPILRLTDYCAGPKAYVRRLEDVLIATLGEWAIQGRRREGLPGVWVGDDQPLKIASIGVRISQGVTMHGFALNVSLDLAPFSSIIPCGIAGCRVTSMAALLGCAPEMAAVQQHIAAHFAERFHLTWVDTLGADSIEMLGEPPDDLGPAPIAAPFIAKERLHD
ncbi:MAG TPA: lipoyl(octanoyl) transferase LipB [Nitrospira sp.]|nr:lipoyl(octanoyl) transferase LipB [Nitrospira sp.]HUM40268.1 lipoyl(octanoyl) transferase LipB [Nitrospira sp.]